MKYVGDLHKSIQKELKLFKARDINETSMKAMWIEKKNRFRKDKKAKKHVNMTVKNY